MNMLSLLRRLMREAQAQPPQRSRTGTSRKRTGSTAAGTRKKQGTVSRSQTVYGEETLLRSFEEIFEPVPKEIRQMRSISGYENGKRSLESLFYAQGKFMENYTDSYGETVTCERVMPTYTVMTNNELRAYFSWRTRYRLGGRPATQNAFLLLYAYEQLNIIGAADPACAYEEMSRLITDYGALFPSFQKMALRWMPDFAAYYGLPYRCENAREAAALTVLRHSAHTPDNLLAALDSLSAKYHLRQSKLYLAKPELTAEVLQAVYHAMLLYYAEVRKQSYSAYLLGEQHREEHILFEGAVFRFRGPQPDRSIRLSPLCVYHCCKGKWAIERFCSDPHSDRIGALLRTTDAILREQVKFKGKLKYGDLPEDEITVIRKAVSEYFLALERKNAPVITLNPAELEAIRRAAEHTTDMLTLPEEPEEVLPQPELVLPEPAQPETEKLPDVPLSEPALALLLCLLTGESYQPLLDAGHMLTVLADEINETLYDEIGDSVIETDGMTAELIPDYIGDLKGWLQL